MIRTDSSSFTVKKDDIVKIISSLLTNYQKGRSSSSISGTDSVAGGGA